jgi:hypothetical protein
VTSKYQLLEALSQTLKSFQIKKRDKSQAISTSNVAMTLQVIQWLETKKRNDVTSKRDVT